MTCKMSNLLHIIHTYYKYVNMYATTRNLILTLTLLSCSDVAFVWLAVAAIRTVDTLQWRAVDCSVDCCWPSVVAVVDSAITLLHDAVAAAAAAVIVGACVVAVLGFCCLRWLLSVIGHYLIGGTVGPSNHQTFSVDDLVGASECLAKWLLAKKLALTMEHICVHQNGTPSKVLVRRMKEVLGQKSKFAIWNIDRFIGDLNLWSISRPRSSYNSVYVFMFFQRMKEPSKPSPRGWWIFLWSSLVSS